MGRRRLYRPLSAASECDPRRGPAGRAVRGRCRQRRDLRAVLSRGVFAGGDERHRGGGHGQSRQPRMVLESRDVPADRGARCRHAFDLPASAGRRVRRQGALQGQLPHVPCREHLERHGPRRRGRRGDGRADGGQVGARAGRGRQPRRSHGRDAGDPAPAVPAGAGRRRLHRRDAVGDRDARRPEHGDHVGQDGRVVHRRPRLQRQ